MQSYSSSRTKTKRWTAKGIILLVWIHLWGKHCAPLQAFGFTRTATKAFLSPSSATTESSNIQRWNTPIRAASDDQESSPSSTSAESIQQRLVQYGLAWKQAPLEELSKEQSLTRVPGCVATVYVRATLTDKNEKNCEITKDTPIINIFGHSDAIVSRGLMAILVEYLQQPSITLKQILELNPAEVADLLGIRPALSPGRNDGLANICLLYTSPSPRDRG